MDARPLELLGDGTSVVLAPATGTQNDADAVQLHSVAWHTELLEHHSEQHGFYVLNEPLGRGKVCN